MAVKFNHKTKQQNPQGIDHNDLLNRGAKSHEELDKIHEEVSEARGGFASLKLKLTDILGKIITSHNQLSNIGLKSHTELDNIHDQVVEARGNHNTLKEKLDSLKPVMKLSELDDVEVSTIQDKQTIIWDSIQNKFVPGVASSGGSGSGGVNIPTKLSHTLQVEYDSSGNVHREIYTGDIQKIIEYTYDSSGNVTEKMVTHSDGTVYKAMMFYDSSGNIEKIIDTGTEEIVVASGGSSGSGVPQDIIDKISILEKRLMNTVSNMIHMQFKYDITLNLTKNRCNDFFIDVLEDDSNIEQYQNTSYDVTDEIIK